MPTGRFIVHLRHRFLAVLLGGMVLSLITMLWGCNTTREVKRTDDLLREAAGDFQKRNYEIALTKIKHYINDPYAEKTDEDMALHLGALCSVYLERPESAIEFVELLRSKYPDSKYNNERLVQIEEKAKEQLETKEQKHEQTQEKLWAEIEAAEAKVKQSPNSAIARVELGHLYWRAGRFEDCLQQYQAAKDLDESILQLDLVRKRIRLDERGALALKDHPVLKQKEGPLKVTSLNVQRETKRSFIGYTPDVHRYILSGQIENDDIRDYPSVEIEITLYDFFEKILETKRMAIGTIPAGGRRPFVADFQGFAGDEFSVNRYEVVVYSNGNRAGGALGH